MALSSTRRIRAVRSAGGGGGGAGCPGAAATARVAAAHASELLAGMPANQRDVIYLKHFADCTFAEIGTIVGIPTFTAASRYRKGISDLRNLMKDEP